jgi:TolB-like protein
MSDAPDIFLSYNREDAVVAKRFADAFAREGMEVWWDVTLRSGDAYDAVTEEALRIAKVVVVLWSKKSVVSRWVRAEATLADRNRTLVPARIESCDLPIMFELTQTADLSHWQGNVGDSAWRAFLTDIRQIVATKALPAPPPTFAAIPQPTRDRKPSIAVLPFINRSGRAEDDVFADGMVEDLTTALSLSRRMKVIAASATATYRMGARDLRQIGHDLGVRYLLEGNIRRAGDDLRVTAQLVEADEGDILWTQKFDRPLVEVAGLQEELVTEVAAHLGAQVERAEIEHALRKPDNISAWETVLRAEAALSRHTEAGVTSALAEARRAIAIDPSYDVAHAVVVVALGMLRDFRVTDDAELTRELAEAVVRLRKLDSSDPVVLARLATGLAYLGRHEEALFIAEQAVATNPNIELTHMALATVLIHIGRGADALPELTVAEAIAPNGVWFYASLSIRSMVLLVAGRFEEALAATDQSLRVRPVVVGKINKMLCLANLDRSDEARTVMRDVRMMIGENAFEPIDRLARGQFRGTTSRQIEEFVTTLRRLWVETKGDP